MFNDLHVMLLLIPITIVLVLFLAYSWMNINNDNVEEKRESGRDPEELAPAWLLIILHGLSELHDKLQLEVGEIVKISKISMTSKTFYRDRKYSEYLKYFMIHIFHKRCTSSTPRSACWRRGWTTCQW